MRKILFMLVFPVAFLFSQNYTTLESGNFDPGLGICGTIFITDEKIQQAIENTRIYNPELYQKMVAEMKAKPLGVEADTLGTIRSFYVYNFVKNQFDQVNAKLMAIGNLTQVWVDTAEINNGHVDQEVVDSIFNALEKRTPPTSRNPNKGIVELDHEYFGLPPNVDGDGKTDFLIVDIKDGWQPGSGYIAGFFFSNDQYPRTGSNRRDMLYIDSYPGIYYNGQRNPAKPLSTLAHEYQHLIHFHYDKDEATFVNEGLSEVAEVICGYPLRNPSRYFQNTDVPLFDWGNISGNVLADYSRAALFTLYYTEQLGDSVLKKVVQEPGNGVYGINNVLSSIGAGVDFNGLFTNFCIANYLNDRTVATEYGYVYPVSGKPKETHFNTAPNVSAKDSVYNYAVDYIAFAYGESLKVTFTGSGALTIKAIELSKSGNKVVNVPLNQEFSVPEFGTTVDLVVFAVVNTTGVRAGYSYTSTGKQRSVIVEVAYDDGTPDRFSGNANFLGFGNNRVGFGWAVKFVPEVPINQLMKAKIYAAFAQEFSGSSVPPDAPKDFYFHVWDDNNGLPGNDIITPFIVSTNRSGFTGDFITIDLSGYADKLKNLGTIYIGFTENDSIGTYVGMDSTTKDNYTYAFFGPTHDRYPNQWFPMSDLKLSDGTSLAGWNMMMRAVFSYTDTTTPKFAAGYFQNPIFSEYLDIFIVGNSPLNKDNLSATLTINNNTTQLTLTPVPNTNDRVFVDNSIKLSSSGTIEIRVSGTTKYGLIFSDTVFTFNVQFLESVKGGFITSTDGIIEVDFPANSLKRNLYLIAFKGNSDVLNEKIKKSLPVKLSEIYTISPVGEKLNSPAVLKIKLDPEKLAGINPNEITVAYWDSSKWVALNSILSSTKDMIIAEVNKLGQFVVTKKTYVEASEVKPEIPDKFELYQNYPNPFNPETSIRFDLPKDSYVTLKVYDVLGREIKTLVSEFKPAGSYLVTWDGKDKYGRKVSSGVYFYRMTAGEFTKVRKMIITK